MKFVETKLKDVWIIDIEPLCDERGFFARTMCAKEFKSHGLRSSFVQSSISYNKVKGTLRGMHYQVEPYQEIKLVRCIKGAVYDVVLDLRSGSPTFGQWSAMELTQDNNRAVYIPEGCAHGFQTIMDDAVVAYEITEFFHPECAQGVRWNDQAFKIKWPQIKNRIISKKDGHYPDFKS